MSDPTQNPRPGESEQPSAQPEQPPGETSQPPGTWSSQPPPPGQGSYGTTPPPPQGDWQQGDWQGGRQQPGAGQQRPGPYPTPGPTGGIGQPAELLPRFVARLIDFLLVGFVAGAIGAILLAVIAVSANGLAFAGWGIPDGVPYAVNATTSVVTAALYLAYFTLMEAKRGQTVGKMVMKLETRGPGGGRPTTEQAFKRNAWTGLRVLTVIPFIGWLGGLLWVAAVIAIAVTIANSPTRRGWHDDFAGGTTVFRIG